MDQDARIANRATWLTLLSVCSFMLVVLTMPSTFRNTDRLAPRIAASTPLAAGLVTGVLARAARIQLRALRGEADSVVSMGPAAASSTGEPPHPPGGRDGDAA